MAIFKQFVFKIQYVSITLNITYFHQPWLPVYSDWVACWWIHKDYFVALCNPLQQLPLLIDWQHMTLIRWRLPNRSHKMPQITMSAVRGCTLNRKNIIDTPPFEKLEICVMPVLSYYCNQLSFLKYSIDNLIHNH